MLIAPRFHFPLPFFESSACEKLHSPWSLRSLLASMCLACVASVSARVRREKLGREQKKGMTGEGEGEGEEEERNACPQTPSLRTADVFPIVASVRPKKGGTEATTGSTSAIRRQTTPKILKKTAFPHKRSF